MRNTCNSVSQECEFGDKKFHFRRYHKQSSLVFAVWWICLALIAIVIWVVQGVIADLGSIAFVIIGSVLLFGSITCFFCLSVFRNTLLELTVKEKVICIRRSKQSEYIPWDHVVSITVGRYGYYFTGWSKAMVIKLSNRRFWDRSLFIGWNMFSSTDSKKIDRLVSEFKRKGILFVT